MSGLVLTAAERARLLAQVNRRAPRQPVAKPLQSSLALAEARLEQALAAWHRAPEPKLQLLKELQLAATKLKQERGR